MWNKNIGVAVVDCIAVVILLIAACGLFKFGYEYAQLLGERDKLLETIEEISAEKAMLEGLISHIPVVRPATTNQGWIPPKALEK